MTGELAVPAGVAAGDVIGVTRRRGSSIRAGRPGALRHGYRGRGACRYGTACSIRLVGCRWCRA
ncbi:hypothetical protein, partial [Actinoplanes sp. TBRC 11911]|uniref:hypothetical protein n=1 Tax=Actinoplanes sp. TBRC 11911 TaxID=2729386 RepID=UPI001B7D5C19